MAIKRLITVVICSILLISICFCFSACGSNPLVGQWESEKTGDIISFYNDGSCDIPPGNVSKLLHYMYYEINDNGYLMLSTDKEGFNSYSYEINGDKLRVYNIDAYDFDDEAIFVKR